MKIHLFPDQLITQDACFGLFRGDPEDKIDPLIAVESDIDVPLHIVHSDPAHLAYLAGLIALQDWTYGIDEQGIPRNRRRPVLIVTDRAGSFAENYLELHIRMNALEEISRLHRVRLGGAAVDVWDLHIYKDRELREQTSRLHNYFPCFHISGKDSEPRQIADRMYRGRNDIAGPAVITTKQSDRETLLKICERFGPVVVLFDTPGRSVPTLGAGVPNVFYHDSVFSPQLIKKDAAAPVCCLPDAKFERFCSGAGLLALEPDVSEEITGLWKNVDSALLALIERLNRYRERVVVEVYRAASRLRNLLLSLPVGVQAYEQAFRLAGINPAIWHDWSVAELLQSLENRVPELAALGEWEELVMQELVGRFRQLEEKLQVYSPKQGDLLSAVRNSIDQSRRAVLVVESQAVAEGLKFIAPLPEPYGLGLPAEQVTVIPSRQLRTLEPDQDCIIHQAFDPYHIFSALAASEPRQVTFILLQNELRFVGEYFLRFRQVLPDHPCNTTILKPVYHHLERLQDTGKLTRQDRGATLFSDLDFEMIKQVFNKGVQVREFGTVLAEESAATENDLNSEAAACLVLLEGQNAVFLNAALRVSYVSGNDDIFSGLPSSLEVGHRLIIINASARDSIAQRIFAARYEKEREHSIGQLIERWQTELADGVRRLGLTYGEVLRRIQGLGSQRLSAAVVGQWIRGSVLGPLDAEDIRRIGQVTGSEWLLQNWQRVGLALVSVRSGHILLGKQITRIIQKAAVGDYELAQQDIEFLTQVGIAPGELQDAVTLLAVEAVSDEAETVPVSQIGQVVPI